MRVRALALLMLALAACGGEVAPDPSMDSGCHLVPTGSQAIFDLNLVCGDAGPDGAR